MRLGYAASQFAAMQALNQPAWRMRFAYASLPLTRVTRCLSVPSCPELLWLLDCYEGDEALLAAQVQMLQGVTKAMAWGLGPAKACPTDLPDTVRVVLVMGRASLLSMLRLRADAAGFEKHTIVSLDGRNVLCTYDLLSMLRRPRLKQSAWRALQLLKAKCADVPV